MVLQSKLNCLLIRHFLLQVKYIFIFILNGFNSISLLINAFNLISIMEVVIKEQYYNIV